MGKNPLVSIIIPCYNHSHFLPNAINSILAQTLVDWEAIIINDGSTDATHEVATRFTDPRIRYIYQENRGLSAARNTGIQAARGTLLAFLDADDEWEVDFLKHCVTALEENETLGFVYTQNRYIDADGHLLPQIGGEALCDEHFRMRLLEGGFFPIHAALLRRCAIETVEGGFDDSLSSVEDWDLWLRISRHFPVRGIAKPLARYRVYPGSMSTDAERMHQNRMAVLAKHFGPQRETARDWAYRKRVAYAFAHRLAAFDHIAQQQPEIGWQHLQHAATIHPAILARLDTFYELALGDQPRGYRGQAESVDLVRNGIEIHRRLESLFEDAPAEVIAMKSRAFANTYLALSMLNEQGGHWDRARRYLLQALWVYPQLLTAPGVLRRLLKLSAGRQVITTLQSCMQSSA